MKNLINPYLLRCKQNKTVFIDNPERMKGAWGNEFDREAPIFLDLGCGNGAFLLDQAEKNKSYNFIGVERASKFLFRGVKNATRKKIKNVKFVHYDIREIANIFTKSEIEGIYLLFSDPYNKAKHLKHRVFNQSFLDVVSNILKEKRFFVIKTDRDDYSCDIKTQLAKHKDFDILFYEKNFNKTGYVLEDIKTYYEKKFAASGINWILAQKKG